MERAQVHEKNAHDISLKQRLSVVFPAVVLETAGVCSSLRVQQFTCAAVCLYKRFTYVCNHTALAATSVGKQSTVSEATHRKVTRLDMRAHTPATMMTAWPSLWPVPPSAAAMCTS